ncbi:MAG: glycogen debranching N-terminal domain-containing protein, partial [Acidimicrobiales bacterium]
MSEPWTYAGEVSVLGQSSGVVTLVDESTFAISGRVGDIVPPSAQGLFVRDTRILSRFELRMNGVRPEGLAEASDNPFSATFVARCQPRPGRADSTLMVFRARYIGQGMREDITIRNFADEPTFCSIELFVDSDFADLFAVKEGRAANPDGAISRQVGTDNLEFYYRRGTVNRGAVLHFSPTPAVVGDDLVTFEAIVPARGEWRACVEVHPV